MPYDDYYGINSLFGNSVYNFPYIELKLLKPQTHMRYGLPGKDAKLYTKLYPTFGMTTVRIYPAQNGGFTTKIVKVNDDGTTETIKTVGDDLNAYGENFIENETKNKFADLISSVKDKVTHNDTQYGFGSVFNNIHGSNPLKYDIDHDITPLVGKGGNGSYRADTSISGTTTSMMYPPGQHRDQRNTPQQGNMSWKLDTTVDCEQVPVGDHLYCLGTRGNPGAVVITW